MSFDSSEGLKKLTPSSSINQESKMSHQSQPDETLAKENKLQSPGKKLETETQSEVQLGDLISSLRKQPEKRSSFNQPSLLV